MIAAVMINKATKNIEIITQKNFLTFLHTKKRKKKKYIYIYYTSRYGL